MNVAHGITVRSRLAVFAALAIALACGTAQADPPGRAGRVSALDGSATLQQGSAAPAPAALNWPVTAGERISTAPGSRLELRIGSTAVQLDGDSGLAVDALDDQRLALRLEHGRMALQVRSNELVRNVTLATPQGRVLPQGPGRWRVEAGLAADTTSVAAFDAPVTFAGSDDADTRATVAAGRMLRISGLRALSLQNLPLDAPAAFDRWVADRDARDSLGRSGPYVSPEMTGAEDLDRYGAWAANETYGPVWYPAAVAVDWAPYRVGRWIWVEPWGWTWVDAAPWGFAPFHYGRWSLIEGRWGWVPGAYVAAPVYAPAVVGWIGGRGWSVSAATGPSVGWFPLAPFEPYYPGVNASVAYLRRLNAASVHDVAHMTATVDLRTVHYANRELPRAVTVVPVAAMAAGHEVARVAVPVHDARLLAGWPMAAHAPRSLAAAPAGHALAEAPVRREEAAALRAHAPEIGRMPLVREHAAVPPRPEAPHEAFGRDRREFGPELRERRAEIEHEHERGHGER